MIDFILGLIAGAAIAAYAIYHFKGEAPAKLLPDLAGFLSTLEARIKTMIADALNDLKTAYEADKAKAVAEATAAAEQKAADAANTQAAADEQAVRDFTAANFPPEQPAA